MSITPNYPCLITSVEPDRSWEGFSATEKIPWLGVGGGVLDGEQSCRAVVDGGVGGTVGLLLFFLLLFPPHKMNQEPLDSFPNRCLTTTWAKRNPSQKEEGRRGRESFGGHHCGNVVNCAFLRPWESHTRAGTCGHGKRGLPPPREEMSDAEQHHLITWCGGAGSDAHSLLCIRGQFDGTENLNITIQRCSSPNQMSPTFIFTLNTLLDPRLE